MNKIKITYYKFKNDAETAFNNVLSYAIHGYEEKHFDDYAEYLYRFNDFKKFFEKKIALVEFDEEMEYLCFTCKNKLFYNVENKDLCFTDFSGSDFESMHSYIEDAKNEIRKIGDDFDITDDLIMYLAVSREEYEKCGEEIIEYKPEDIKEY